MANLIVSVITSVALMATLCYAVPNLVFKDVNGANDKAQFGEPLRFAKLNTFASNELSADLPGDIRNSPSFNRFQFFGIPFANGEGTGLKVKQHFLICCLKYFKSC